MDEKTQKRLQRALLDRLHQVEKYAKATITMHKGERDVHNLANIVIRQAAQDRFTLKRHEPHRFPRPGGPQGDAAEFLDMIGHLMNPGPWCTGHGRMDGVITELTRWPCEIVGDMCVRNGVQIAQEAVNGG